MSGSPIPCGKSFSQDWSGTFGPVTLIEFAGAQLCEGAIILEGIPGEGMTATIATGYLLEQLQLPLVGVMVSDEFPPLGIVSMGQPLPPVRIYGDSKIVVVLAEFKPVGSAVIAGICDAVLEFARRHCCKRVISVDGYASGESTTVENFHETKTADVQFVTTDAKIWEILKNVGCKPIGSAILSGVTGTMVSKSAIRVSEVDPSVTCLLSASSKGVPDAWGAVHVIVAIEKITKDLEFQIMLDIAPLEKKATELESKVSKLIGDLGRSMSSKRGELMSMYS